MKVMLNKKLITNFVIIIIIFVTIIIILVNKNCFNKILFKQSFIRKVLEIG